MIAQVQAVYEKGILRLLEPLNLPESTRVTVTVMPETNQRFKSPTRPQPLSQLLSLVGVLPVGGDALAESEALYDED